MYISEYGRTQESPLKGSIEEAEEELRRPLLATYKEIFLSLFRPLHHPPLLFFFRETQETKYSTLNLIALWKKSTICWEKEIFKWWGMCPWICWNKESLIVYGARGAQTPWVVLEKELETSLLNSTTALMDQHQLNHQFCGQSQHTQHIQQKKQKRAFSGLHLYHFLQTYHKKISTFLRHIFLFLSSRFGLRAILHREYLLGSLLEHEEEQLMMEFSEFSAKVPIP